MTTTLLKNTETPDYRDIDPETGQQLDYEILTKDAQASGRVRPYRDAYIHSSCGGLTKMAAEIAETYACDPTFYTGTFCVHCKKHFPLAEFVWDGTNITVGS
jgi:hypothetical protein